MLKKSLKEILHFYGHAGGDERLLTYVAFDSRKVKPGTLFFALKGEKVDGHEFLLEVAKRGGVAAVVSNEYKGPNYELTLIPVQDVAAALQKLAQEEQKQSPSLVIGVTGTVGKTTMKEFIAVLLEEKFPVAKTPGNANSQVSLPLTLINRIGCEQAIVLEMGMSFPGEITRLIRMAPPDIGVLTQVSLVHAENFPGIEAIAQAKCELFQDQAMKLGFFQTGTLEFNAVKELSCTKTTYGKGGDYTLEVRGKQVIVFEHGEKSPPIKLPFVESHLLENFLGAAAIARHFGLTWEEIARGVSKLKPYHHRFEKITKNGILFIDDAYNASPIAVKAALANLPQAKPGKKIIAALGAMKELGAFSDSSHREVATFALPIVDHLLCLGDECQPMVDVFQGEKPVELLTDLKALRERVKELATQGDVVLVKGANSLKMWTILD